MTPNTFSIYCTACQVKTIVNAVASESLVICPHCKDLLSNKVISKLPLPAPVVIMCKKEETQKEPPSQWDLWKQQNEEGNKDE